MSKKLETKTVEQLKAEMAKYGVRECDIKGSGKNGAIIKKDRVKALKNRTSSKRTSPVKCVKQKAKSSKVSTKKSSVKKSSVESLNLYIVSSSYMWRAGYDSSFDGDPEDLRPNGYIIASTSKLDAVGQNKSGYNTEGQHEDGDLTVWVTCKLIGKASPKTKLNKIVFEY
jgi:hypothetical protein